MTDRDSLRRAMERALELARRGRANDPNPRVGCVLLDADGHPVAEGFHRGAGSPHAEVDALSGLSSPGQAVTAVVTLEPCNHTGRTGPCSQALVAAGIRRVVFAQADPNPCACGGAGHLAAAGVEVSQGLCEAEAVELNRCWSHRLATGRPFVTWKFASTLDGYSAAADGSSQWITGEEMRWAMNQRRAECGAIVVGTGTVLADDPRLTVRDRSGAALADQPLRVVVGRREVPAGARVRGNDQRFLQVDATPAQVLEMLASRGVNHVWLEGGPTLAAVWLRAGVVDEVISCIAPALLGSGRPAVADLGVGTIADIVRLHPTQVVQIGTDIAVIATPTKEK